MAYLPLYLVLGFLNAAHSYSECYTERMSSLRFTVNSAINEQGQTIVSVEGLGEDRDADTVGLSVEHWTARCNDLQVVGLQLNITSPASVPGPPPVTDIVPVHPPAREEPILVVAEQPTTTPLPTLACKTGYILLPGVGCYRHFYTRVTWEDARRSCEAEGAYLAAPATKAESDILRPPGTTKWAFAPWMGIYKTDGTWKTIEGGPVFLDWAPGEPKGRGPCTTLWHNGLYDFRCKGRGPYICKQRLV